MHQLSFLLLPIYYKIFSSPLQPNRSLKSLCTETEKTLYYLFTIVDKTIELRPVRLSDNESIMFFRFRLYVMYLYVKLDCLQLHQFSQTCLLTDFFFADPIKGHHAMLIAKSVVLEAIDQEWMNPMQSPLYLTSACRSTAELVIIEVILTKPLLKPSQTNLFSENIIVTHTRCSTMKPVTLRMILWSNIKLIN